MNKCLSDGRQMEDSVMNQGHIVRMAREVGFDDFEQDAMLERFAKLIVRECCFIGEQWAEGVLEPKHYNFVNKKIKRHFGVEE